MNSGSQAAPVSGCYRRVFRTLDVGLLFSFLLLLVLKDQSISSTAVVLNPDRRCVCFRSFRSSSACCVSCSVRPLPTRRFCCSTLRSASESLYVNFTHSHKSQITEWCLSATPHRITHTCLCCPAVRGLRLSGVGGRQTDFSRTGEFSDQSHRDFPQHPLWTSVFCSLSSGVCPCFPPEKRECDDGTDPPGAVTGRCCMLSDVLMFSPPSKLFDNHICGIIAKNVYLRPMISLSKFFLFNYFAFGPKTGACVWFWYEPGRSRMFPASCQRFSLCWNFCYIHDTLQNPAAEL